MKEDIDKWRAVVQEVEQMAKDAERTYFVTQLELLKWTTALAILAILGVVSRRLPPGTHNIFGTIIHTFVGLISIVLFVVAILIAVVLFMWALIIQHSSLGLLLSWEKSIKSLVPGTPFPPEQAEKAWKIGEELSNAVKTSRRTLERLTRLTLIHMILIILGIATFLIFLLIP